jgi:hypothetical protein
LLICAAAAALPVRIAALFTLSAVENSRKCRQADGHLHVQYTREAHAGGTFVLHRWSKLRSSLMLVILLPHDALVHPPTPLWQFFQFIATGVSF